MKRNIVFERRKSAYLPEIDAYMEFLKKNFSSICAYDSATLDRYNPLDFDVVWRFMGFDLKGSGNAVIHEYNSLSTGYMPRAKNVIKKTLNTKPIRRIFLNELVKNGFSFRDHIPYRCRDMGVSASFFEARLTKKQYDFVYAGSLGRGPLIFSVLEHFKKSLPSYSLLLIGEVPDHLHERFKNVPNITFTGRVPYQNVAPLIATARYGLNLMPDEYPLNMQTATKVLEYCALNMPVISTDYRWIRQFEQTRAANFFYLKPDLHNFTIRNLESHPFITPDVSDCTWDNIIEKSGVFDILTQ